MTFRSPAAAFAVIAALALAIPASAAPPTAQAPETVGLFEAMESGDIDVKLIVRDGANARIVAHNNTKKPLTIQIPDAFAAVPVLAQNQGGGGGGGQGAFSVPPEKVAKHDVGFLCLEHGDPDPRSTMKYEIKPIEAITTDEQVIEVVKQFGAGNFGHSASQAAVWHLANKMSWRELASKRRRRLGGINQPYFSKVQLQQASNIVTHVASIEQTDHEPSESLAQ